MTGHPFALESEVDVHIDEQCIAVDDELVLPSVGGEACHSTDPSWAPSEDTSVTPILPRDAHFGCEGGGDYVKMQLNRLLRTSVASQHALTYGSPDQRLKPLEPGLVAAPRSCVAMKPGIASRMFLVLPKEPHSPGNGIAVSASPIPTPAMISTQRQKPAASACSCRSNVKTSTVVRAASGIGSRSRPEPQQRRIVSATASATVNALAGMTAAHAVATAAPMRVPTTRFIPFARVSLLRGWITTTAEIVSQMPCVRFNPCHSAVVIPAAAAARMV
jgi:hypothetical protein